MGFKNIEKIKKKSYKGIYGYYKDSDHDKTIISYYIAYRDIDGKVKKVKCDALNALDAKEILSKKRLELERERGRIAKGELQIEKKKANKRFTLDEYANIFHANRENKDATAEKAMYHNHISPILGAKKIAKITREDIVEFRKSLQSKKVKTFVIKKTYENDITTAKRVTEKRGLAPKTIKSLLDYLRVILNNAIDDDYIESSPLDLSQYKSKEKRTAEKKKIYGNGVIDGLSDSEDGRVLTEEELRDLWELDELKMNDRLFLFLKACYVTGARPAGIIDLQVKHINFSDKKIRIKSMKKSPSYQAYANDELLGLLKQWISKYSLTHDNYIFFPIQSYQRAITDKERGDAKGKSANYSGYRRYLQKIFDPKFNVNTDSRDKMNRINVYSMRRTAATKVYRKFGIVHAKDFLNHTDIKTTMHYLNVKNDAEGIDYGL